MKFNNRTAVITGAAGRIGMAAARALGQYKVKLFLADINLERAEEAAAQLGKEDIDAAAVKMDVSDLQSIQTAAADILAKAGKVDILVNNAGAWPRGGILNTTDEEWNRMVNLNLTSVFRVSQAFLPAMVEHKYGRIINLGSIAGIAGLPGYIAYSTCKAGVQMMTKVMAMELAKKGITVNSISPGLIGDEVNPTTGTWLGRTGLGEDVARAIVYLASDDASYITGSDMPVDGGRTLGPLNPSYKG